MPHSSNRKITLDLTTSFADVVDPTPFGTYDNEAAFVSASDGLVKYVYNKLGGDVLQIELTPKHVYSANEEATLEYSNLVNTYHARSILADIIGSATGSLTGQENKVSNFNLALAKRRASAYSSEGIMRWK